MNACLITSKYDHAMMRDRIDNALVELRSTLLAAANAGVDLSNRELEILAMLADEELVDFGELEPADLAF